MQETQEMPIRSLGRVDSMEESMATYSSMLAWRIPWTEEPGGYGPEGCKELDTTEVTVHTCTQLLYTAVDFCSTAK